jgi:hypothetical protein
MPFNIAAGFASSRTTVLSSTETHAARVQPAPPMQQMAIRLGYDSLLSRISGGICENAFAPHRLDLERLGRRAEVECQLQDTLTDLKDRIARKAAVRTRPATVDRSVELYYKAS